MFLNDNLYIYINIYLIEMLFKLERLGSEKPAPPHDYPC